MSFWWTGRWFRQQPNASRDSISEGQDNVWSPIFGNWIVQQMGRQAPPQTAGLWILHMWRSSPKRTRFPEAGSVKLWVLQASRLLSTWQASQILALRKPLYVELGPCPLEITSSTNHRNCQRRLTLTENSWRWAGLTVDSGGEGASWWRPRKAFPTYTSPLQQQIAYFMPLSKKVKTSGLI